MRTAQFLSSQKYTDLVKSSFCIFCEKKTNSITYYADIIKASMRSAHFGSTYTKSFYKMPTACTLYV